MQPSLPSQPSQMRLYYRLLPSATNHSSPISPSLLVTSHQGASAPDASSVDCSPSHSADIADPMVGPDGIRYREFEDARGFVQRLHLFRGQWPAWRDGPDRPRDIPRNPDVVYRLSGGSWIDWGDWLGVSLRPNSVASGRGMAHAVQDARNGKRSREQLASFLENTRPFRIRITLPTSQDEVDNIEVGYAVVDANDLQRCATAQSAKVKTTTGALAASDEGEKTSVDIVADKKAMPPPSPSTTLPVDMQLLSSFEPLYGGKSSKRAPTTPESASGRTSSESKESVSRIQYAEDDIVREIRSLQSNLVVQESESRRVADILTSKVRAESDLMSFDQRTSGLREFQKVLQCYDELVAEEHRNLAALQRRAEEDMDANCAVCGSGEVGPSNQIVFCEYCNVAVHQHCYGVEFIPDGDWFCQPCTAVVPEETRKRIAASTAKETQPVLCKLCPAKVGAVFPSDDPENWVHTVCADVAGLDAVPIATLVREQIAADDEAGGVPAMPHISSPAAVGVSSVDLERVASLKAAGSKPCSVCGEAGSSVAICSWEKCNKALHISCAQSRACEVRCDRIKSDSGAPGSIMASRASAVSSSSSTLTRPEYPLRRQWTMFCQEHSFTTSNALIRTGGEKASSQSVGNSSNKNAAINVVPGTDVRGPSADGSWFIAGDDKTQRAKELDAIGIRSCHLCRARKPETVLCCFDSRKCRVAFCRQHVERFGDDFKAVANNERWQCYKCRGLCTCSACTKAKVGNGANKLNNSGPGHKGNGHTATTAIECTSDGNGSLGHRGCRPFDAGAYEGSVFSTNPQQLRFDTDGARCGVCAKFGPTESGDPILCCRACGVFVHESCFSRYSSSEIARDTSSGTFVCDVCHDSLTSEEQNVANSAAGQAGAAAPDSGSSGELNARNVDTGTHCQICPVPQGFRIKSQIGADSSSIFYMHGACYRAVRQQKQQACSTEHGDGDVSNVCCACGFGEGVMMQCHEAGCKMTYHLLCASQAGFEPSRCHIHTAPRRLQARMLAGLIHAGQSDAQQYHNACALITELTWAHIPFAGQVPPQPLVELAYRLRRQQFPMVAFADRSDQGVSLGTELRHLLTSGLDDFSDIDAEQASLISKMLHEIYVRTPEALLLKDRSVPVLRCSLCDKPYDGRYCLQSCPECKSIFHPACDHWKLDMDNASQPHMQRNGKLNSLPPLECI